MQLNNPIHTWAGKEFRKIFRLSVLKVWDFHAGCLDTIALDAWLKVPDGVSTSDYIRDNFGTKAVTVCMELLHLKGEKDGTKKASD